MTTTEIIAEAAAKVGLDYDTARDLHRALCRNADPAAPFAAAPFAAELLLQAIDHYAAADRIMHRLAVLATTEAGE